MKNLFFEITEEIYIDPLKNRWKWTRCDQPYSWEEAQNAVYEIAQTFGTEEIVARIFYSNNPEKYPKIYKSDKKWEKGFKESLTRLKEYREQESRLREHFIKSRWPNGVPKPNLERKPILVGGLAHRRRRKPKRKLKFETFKQALQNPVKRKELEEKGRAWLQNNIDRE